MSDLHILPCTAAFGFVPFTLKPLLESLTWNQYGVLLQSHRCLGLGLILQYQRYVSINEYLLGSEFVVQTLRSSWNRVAGRVNLAPCSPVLDANSHRCLSWQMVTSSTVGRSMSFPETVKATKAAVKRGWRCLFEITGFLHSLVLFHQRWPFFGCSFLGAVEGCCVWVMMVFKWQMSDSRAISGNWFRSLRSMLSEPTTQSDPTVLNKLYRIGFLLAGRSK